MREPSPRFTTASDGIPPQPGARRGAILIVEDRVDVRQGLSQLLEFQGFLVFEAGNASETFAQLDSSPDGIALILLDLNLPGHDGQWIRATQLANPLLAAIPAIVVSACPADTENGGDLRAAAWFEKPFRFDQLLAEIRRFVLPERFDAPTDASEAQPPAA
jgi:DNA-binding response OmpR family regulator